MGRSRCAAGLHKVIGACVRFCDVLLRKSAQDRIDNDARRLDQSLQHAVGALYALALSGSARYGLLCAAVNAPFVAQLWGPSRSNDGRRWIPVGGCVVLYTLPLLARGRVGHFWLSLCSTGLGAALAFLPGADNALGGWGHSAFHAALAVSAR